MTADPMDGARFRQLLGHFATGVAVITTSDASGRPFGMTANSIASVSLNPPLLLVCIDHASSMHPLLLQAGAFAVNLLSSAQEGLARRFAEDHPDRFDGVGYRMSDRRLPLVDGALAYIECERFTLHQAGDHTILVGRVVGGETFEGKPLSYYRGGYGGIR